MAPREIGFSSLVSGQEASSNVLACSFLLGTSMLVAYVSKKYSWIYFPESSAALVLGMLFGGVALWLKSDLFFTFKPEIFFYGLLPIIIFNAGYGLKKKNFFKNFSTITLFAVVGTLISAIVYGLLTYALVSYGYITNMTSKSPLLESMMFGALISAIDPVATLSIFQDVEAPSVLYNLVFGESLVNDAASIVLFRTFETFLDEEFSLLTIDNAIWRFVLISVGSIVLGVLVSLLGALVLKYVDIRSEFAKFELSFILVSAYVSYSVAELLSLSGIMALFFCGICNAHYGYYSTSHACKISSKYAFEALSFMAEMFVFAYLGMQVVVQEHVFDRGLLLSAIPLCFISRAANIFPLAWLTNRTRSRKISMAMQLMMWFSGLRGAIAFALSVNMPTRNPALETTTLFIVVTTTLLLGGTTAPTLRALGLTTAAGLSEERLVGDAQGRAAPASHDRDHGNDNGDNDDDHSHSKWTAIARRLRNSRIDVGYIRNTSLNEALMGVASAAAAPQDSAAGAFHVHGLFKWVDETYLKPVFGGQPLVQHRQHEHGGERENGVHSKDDHRLKLVEDKLGSLRIIVGDGFTLSLPSSWSHARPASDDPSVLALYTSPHYDSLGVPEAEISVMCFHDPAMRHGCSSDEPVVFLVDQWQRLCPELSRNPMNSPASKGSSSVASTTTTTTTSSRSMTGQPRADAVETSPHTPVNLVQAPSSGGQQQQQQQQLEDTPPSSNSEKSDDTGSKRGRAGPWLAGDLASQSESASFSSMRQRDPSLRASAAFGSERLMIPAFIMHAERDHSDTHSARCFNYEVVAHPEDLGSQRMEIRHFFLSVWQGYFHAVYVCKVSVTEAFLLKKGRHIPAVLLDSFALKHDSIRENDEEMQ